MIMLILNIIAVVMFVAQPVSAQITIIDLGTLPGGEIGAAYDIKRLYLCSFSGYAISSKY